ncbi:MAG: fumarate reductase subunit C [Gammaproteobacteria bacterium]|jgi:fumarate reductase subunit C
MKKNRFLPITSSNSSVDSRNSIERTPARLDVLQSLSGLALAIFMWAHLLLVSSILISKDAMMWVAGLMEARFISSDGQGYSILVSGFAALILLLFMTHALLALRKFPASWQQHKIIREHMQRMQHADTTQWYWQVVTGFIMFFLGSAHIVIMAVNADKIGPYLSADRFVSEGLWPLYLILLFCAELHGAIGMYRLVIKWGVFEKGDVKLRLKRLKVTKNILTLFFLTLGLATFAAYVKIGIEHRDQAGQRYQPKHLFDSTRTNDVTFNSGVSMTSLQTIAARPQKAFHSFSSRELKTHSVLTL